MKASSRRDYLQSSIGVLEKKSDGSIINMLTTSKLAWFDVHGVEGWVVEKSGSCVVVRETRILVGLHKEMGVL